MEGPTERFRASLADRLADVDTEERLDAILAEIEELLAADLEGEREADVETVVEAVLEWAALTSFAVARFYAPASPWPEALPGWGRQVARRLRRIAARLAEALRKALGPTGAESFSISVGFPWGISVGLSWPLAKPGGP